MSSGCSDNRAMGIDFPVPEGYGTEQLLRRLPSAQTALGQMPEYDFALEADGFYFIDHMGDATTVALALRVLIDEGLRHSTAVQISEL